MTWAEIRRLPQLTTAQELESGSAVGRAFYAYSFRFSYDVAIIMQLKQAIPYYERSWNPATKTWFIVHHREGGWLVDVLPTLKALALRCDEATLIEGNLTTCLYTGKTVEQLQLL